ncbi:MAG: S8 family serine peptidase, partial [Rhizobacter sp.]
SNAGLTGAGIGIAVLDSGIAWQHRDFADDTTSVSRVRERVNFLKSGDATLVGVRDWTPGIDVSGALFPGSASMTAYLSRIQDGFNPKADPYGHGSHVAAVAAGRGAYQSVDTTGVAPSASLYDVKVLDDNGYGQLSDVLAGIDWVIYNARYKNIRVLSLSLGADSTESYRTDPLTRAVRSAVAQGIVVVVAGGNFGVVNGKESYGTISSPGHEPSAITVGSVNTHDSVARTDDTVNNFSSRGPTRGKFLDTASGKILVDNVLKPDLVAPGNKIVSALGADTQQAGGQWNYLARTYPALAKVTGAAQKADASLMMLSGTSISAPVVTGTVALMLQANPGLTPPLVKAILQYTAQPLSGANLLQQGAGMLNVDGAVAMAKALRNDMTQRLALGAMNVGDSLQFSPGAALPAPQSTINGKTFKWSQIVFAGGNRVLTGSALFTKWQGFYDPRVLWVRDRVLQLGIGYYPG